MNLYSKRLSFVMSIDTIDLCLKGIEIRTTEELEETKKRMMRQDARVVDLDFYPLDGAYMLLVTINNTTNDFEATKTEITTKIRTMYIKNTLILKKYIAPVANVQTKDNHFEGLGVLSVFNCNVQ